MATSLIPAGQTSFPLVSGKSVQGLTIVVSTDSDTNPTAPTYTNASLVQDSINNSFTKTLNTGDFALVHTTDMNTTTKQCDPMAVKLVGNYCTAMNSHSKYKGNQLVPTGKVNVGNGTNGLESRVVENNLIIHYDYSFADNTDDPIATLNIGDRVWVKNIYNSSATYPEHTGMIFEALEVRTAQPLYYEQYSLATRYKLIGAGTTPTHSTITLDNSNSPAYKMIETIAEDEDGMSHYQVFAQEMEYNATDSDYADDIPTFPNLTNGTADNLLGVGRVKTIVASTPLNRYFKRG